MMIIGVSGAQGSFSEEAARYYCRENKLTDFRLEYLIDMENVLKALAKNKITLGIFPLVNSRGGVVEQAVVAMGRFHYTLQNIFKILIRHSLLARKGVTKGELREITSHPQALKQCQKYLQKYKKARVYPYSDTAQAAKDLAEGKLGQFTAVVAPAACAKIYRLAALAKNIQDVEDNYTSFLAVRGKS